MNWAVFFFGLLALFELTMVGLRLLARTRGSSALRSSTGAIISSGVGAVVCAFMAVWAYRQ